MTHPVWIGASVPAGVAQLKTFRRLKLGDCVLTLLPMEKSEALAVATYCRKHRIRLYFSELLYRGTTDLCWAARRKMPRKEFYSKSDLEEIVGAAGEFYGGRLVIGEAGGILYWLSTYTIGRRVGEFVNLTPVQNAAQAHDAYVRYLKRFLRYERQELGGAPLLDAESSMVFQYHAEAGIDGLVLESMPGDPHRMHAAIRGVARAGGKPWGTHIASACYGGVRLDELWQKRWKISLYHAYMAGAGFIWPESGHYEYDQSCGQSFSFQSRETRRIRRTLREAHRFSRIHTRPSQGPEVALAVVHGHLDGSPGMWSRHVWGQFKGKKWRAGPAEAGWDLMDHFFRKEDWSNGYVQGERDFSGNPPYGQYDIVPAEAPLRALRAYRCLLFLGWNTMTAPIYRKLREYVMAGGHLVMYLPHLSTRTDRSAPVTLFRNGDFRDLCGAQVLGKEPPRVAGVKCIHQSSLPGYRFPLWRTNTDPRFIGEMTPARLKLSTARVISGYDDYYRATPEQLAARPVVIENSLGKGKVFLIALWQYPGDEELRPLTRDILRTVLVGEQGDIRLLASDRVRYAVYEGTTPPARRKYRVVYLLNTDPDCAAFVRLWVNGKTTRSFQIPAGDLRVAYLLGPMLIAPAKRCVDLRSWRSSRNGQRIEFFNLEEQRFDAQNLGDARVAMTLNGAPLRCEPGARLTLRVARRVDPARRRFFAPDFLHEPAVKYVSAGLAY